MNLEKVVFGFFVLLSATLNFGFFVGDMANPQLHNINELYIAIFVNCVALILKFGDRTQIGAIHLATSLVAVLQLSAAAAYYVLSGGYHGNEGTTASIVSLSAGALLANIVSVVLLVSETISYRRR